MQIKKINQIVLSAFSLGLICVCATHAASQTTTVNTGVPSNPDGERLLQNGEYAKAQVSFENYLQQSPRNSFPEFYGHIGLAEAFLWQGKEPEAKKELKRADSLDKSTPNIPALESRLQDDWAWYFQANNDLPKATEASNKALALRQSEGPEGTFDTIMSLIHTAYLADLQTQYSQSIDLYKQALALMPPQNGDGLLAADVRQRLAAVLWRSGQADEAQRLYQQGLQAQLATNAPAQSYAPHPYWQNVIFRYQAGAPNTSLRATATGEQEVIWANGITVAAVTPQKADNLKDMKVDLAIKNDTNQPVQFLPNAPAFMILAPKATLAPLVNPQALADTIEKKGEKSAKWIKFWGENATMPVTSTYYSQPNPWRWGYGGAPASVAYSGGYGYYPGYNNGGMTTVTTQVPDYAAQQRAMEKAAKAIEDSRAQAENIRDRTLGPTTVQPGAVVKGSLYFDVDKVTKSVLRIPIGNSIFQFEFPPRQ